jgi:exodeoxyribonuclease-5
MSDKTIFDFLHFSQPTKEQKKVLKAMAEFVADENKNDFIVLCGSAGTGKTSITSALIGYLNHKKKAYKISAPTGRAARILGRKSGSLASTIHSMIYTPKADGESGIVNFKLKIGHNSKPTIYIVDEASMISIHNNSDQSLFVTERGLLFDLIAYIKTANVLNKIIFLGDKFQLPPIGETTSMALNKDYLEKTFNLKGEAFLLTEVKRQEDGSYILTNATEIRDAISQGKQSHPIAGTQNKSIYTASDKFVKEQQSSGLENSVAIGVSNKANDFFNKLVREKIFGRACKTLEEGDLLMVTNNWSRNGDVL